MLLIASTISAQSGMADRILQRQTKKAERRVEQKLEQKLEKEVNKTIDEAMDGDPNARNNKTDTRENTQDAREGKPDDEAHMDMAMKMLEGFNRTDAVPDAYRFSHVLHIKTWEDGKEPAFMMMFAGSDDGAFGMESEERPGAITVIDVDRDLMIMFNKDGQSMAMANIMEMAASTSSDMIESESGDIPMNFRATGKSKTIAGYKAEEYIAENAQHTNTVYMSEAVGIDWTGTFTSMMERFAPGTMAEFSGIAQGMVLKSVSVDKKSNKTQYFEVTATDPSGKTLRKSDYTW